MPKPKSKESGMSFADAVESSIPQLGELENAYSQAGPKLPGVKTLPVDNPANPYKVPFDYLEYDFFHEVFVIYRPWNKCNQCADAIGSGNVNMPDTGSYKCPHTDSVAYHQQMNKFLHEGHIRQSQREETLMLDGSIQVSLSWLVPRVNEKKLNAASKKSIAVTSEDP